MAICRLSKTQKTDLLKLVGAFEQARSKLSDFLAELQGEWEAAVDDKSDRWKDGPNGSEAQERLDTLAAQIDALSEDIIDVEAL